MQQQEVLDFWFNELQPEMWWQKSDDLDSQIQERFGELHQKASAGELYAWRKTAEGALAEVIVLDQFSRNIYRHSAQAFSCDAMALVLAQEAIEKDFHRQLSNVERGFLFLPYMHSESAVIHELAVALYSEFAQPQNLEFERKHKAIIDQFGRYPHRNALLGRESSAAELEFLKQPNSSF